MTRDELAPAASSVHAPAIDPTLARRIRIVGLDVDGVLTDGGVYLGASRRRRRRSDHAFELKRYDIQDGLGLHMLRDGGHSSRDHHGSRVRQRRACARRSSAWMRSCRIRMRGSLRRGARRSPISSARSTRSRSSATICRTCPSCAAWPCRWPSATLLPRSTERRTLHLNGRGGFGAVREFAEALLDARGEWHDTVEQYVAVAARASREHNAEPAATV